MAMVRDATNAVRRTTIAWCEQAQSAFLTTADSTDRILGPWECRELEKEVANADDGSLVSLPSIIAKAPPQERGNKTEADICIEK